MRTIGFSLLMCTVAMLGCTQKPFEKPPVKPPEVLVTEAVTDTIVDYEEFTGHTEAKNMVEIRARVTGYLDKVYFTDGDTVKEDDVLFEIDPRPYQTELLRAEAAVHQSQAKFQRLDNDFRRQAVLIRSRAVSQEDFDKTIGERGEAEAAIRVAKAELEKAKLNLEYTKISVRTLDNGGKADPRQPRTGRLSRRMKDPGNLVKADDTVLATIVTLNPMFVYFDVDERTVLALRSLIAQKKIKTINEMSFRFELADDEGAFPYTGKINYVDNKLDSGTGTLQLRGEFENTKGITHGQFVRLRLYVGMPRQAVLVPERALGTDQGQKFLYVVTSETDQEGKTIYKPEYRGGKQLELGTLRDGRRVIEKGVRAGEQVIWSGLQRVRKDTPVIPKNQLPPGAKGAGEKT